MCNKERAFELAKELEAVMKNYIKKLSIDDLVGVASILDIDLTECEMVIEEFKKDSPVGIAAKKLLKKHTCSQKLSLVFSLLFMEEAIIRTNRGEKISEQSINECSKSQSDS